MLTCFHCKTEHPESHYARVVHNRTALYGPWRGWKMAGTVLVSPDRDRITPGRLRGILWAESNQPKRSASGAGSVHQFPALHVIKTGRDNCTG